MTVSYKEERNIHTGTAIVAGMFFYVWRAMGHTVWGMGCASARGLSTLRCHRRL